MSEPAEPPAADVEAWLGRTLAERYLIEDVIGVGGVGAVFGARHLGLGRRVALKVVLDQHADDEDVLERFGREVEVSTRIEDPHVVGSIDCGTAEEGAPFLVMPFVEGHTLADELETEGALGWLRACALARDLACGLSAAHAAGVIHRDLKPDNVMLGRDADGAERAMLLDFGSARLTESAQDEPGERLTRRGDVIGTVGYMAPEQALGQDVDARADLFSLGVLLWEMCAGRRFFADSEASPGEYVEALLARPEPLPGPLAAEVPDAISSLVRGLLASDHIKRPADADRVADRLRAALPAPPAPKPPSPLPWFGLGAAAGVALTCVLLSGFAALTFAAGWWSVGSGEAVVVRAPAEPAEPLPEGVELPAPSPDAPTEGSEIEILLSDRSSPDARRAAARRVLRHEPRSEVEPLTRDLALLEITGDCRARLAALQRVSEQGDARALPSVRRQRYARCRGDFRRQAARAASQMERRLER